MKSSLALLLWAGFAAVCASGQTQPQPPTPVFATGQSARLVIGQTNFTSLTYGASSTLIGTPSGLAYANGVLWVADADRIGGTPSNNRVLRFSDTATYPGPTQDPTIPGSLCGACRGQASLVLGQPDFVSANYTTTASGMRNPQAIATDGNIVAVADTDNNRVLIWLNYPTENGQPADVVIGQPNFTSNGTASPPTAQSLRSPQGVWIAGGKLYVADTGDNRVLIYNQIPTRGNNHVAANVVIGAPNFTTPVQIDITQQNQVATAANMQTPVSVTTDGTRMYVADFGQNRVLIWNQIPTANGAPADVALGQLDLNHNVSDDSFTLNSNNVEDCDGNPEDVTPVMCQSNAAFAASVGQTGTTAVDGNGNTIYPARCAATMSLPRFALSNGTQLFVADAGNDRVLVYNTIPGQSGTPADEILGEPDEFSDVTGTNPSGASVLQTPFALAYDGLNLYVSDSYNRRVVVYTPGNPSVPIGGLGVLNAASLAIHATGTVTVSGSISTKDQLTITINGTDYEYTVLSTDTLETITTALTNKINSAPDKNVIATANTVADVIVITARIPGTIGASITLATSTSSGATETLTTTASTLNLYLQNPSEIAPGTLIEINGQSLCDNTTSAQFTQAYLPTNLNGCEVYADGVPLPLLYASPTQVNAQLPFEFTDRTSTSIYVRNIHADGSVSVSTNVAVSVVPENAGIFAQPGTDPRPAYAYHGFSNAIGLILVGGGVNAGDVGGITIAGTTYTYTVQATDTLQSIANALVAAINSAPDPNVTAQLANEYDTIILVANQPGPAGEGIALTTSVTNTAGSELSLTDYNTATCCDNTAGAPITDDNPAVPGEIIYVYVTGLGPSTPFDINTGQITPAGNFNPPVTPVDSILTDQVAANILSAALVPGTVGVYYVQFEIGLGAATDLLTQTTVAQQSYVSNVVTIPVVAPPTSASSSARPARHASSKAGPR